MRCEIKPSSILEQAYRIYHEANLVKSQSEFSIEVLDRQPAFYWSIIEHQRRPSRRLLVQLREFTKGAMVTLLVHPYFGKSHAGSLNAVFGQLELLVKLINVELETPMVHEQINEIQL